MENSEIISVKFNKSLDDVFPFTTKKFLQSITFMIELSTLGILDKMKSANRFTKKILLLGFFNIIASISIYCKINYSKFKNKKELIILNNNKFLSIYRIIEK